MNKLVIGGFLVMLTLPFIFMTNLFPFLRFSMFAEPVKYNLQSERLVVLTGDSVNGTRAFDPAAVGMESNMFVNLTRNYYYRGQSHQFLSGLHRAVTDSVKPNVWEVVRIMPSADSEGNDSTWVYKFVPGDTLAP